MEYALKSLERRETVAHVQQDSGVAAGGGGGGGIPRHTVSGGCSQEELDLFKSKWDRYVRSSPGVETTELRDTIVLLSR